MFKKLRFFTVIIAVLVLAAGCNFGKEAPQKPDVQMGKIDYDTIDTGSKAFQELMAKQDFQSWYQKNLRKQGAYSFADGENRYILISAGEKDTEGYYLNNIVLTGKEKKIEVKAKLNIPSNKSGLAQTLTYPHILLKLPNDERPLAFSGFEEAQYQVKQESLQGTGKYVGQIDSNSVEIEVKNAAGEVASTAFQLDESLKNDFEEKFGLASGDEVSFSYVVDEYQRNVLKDIKKI